MDLYRQRLEQLLHGTGIHFNGPNPWDPQIHDEAFYKRVLLQGTLGLGESYIEGLWDCEQLDEFVSRALKKQLNRKIGVWLRALKQLQARFTNLQTRARSHEVGRRHYDIGNDLYQRMLDGRMIYSCGYWEHADTLDEAQEHKLELICQKLQLEPGMRVLDIGCGWGGAMAYAAENYGVECVGVTISSEQARYARAHYEGLPLEVRLQDYRTLDEPFDRVFSVGMFEHVGHKNYVKFFDVARRCLKPGGLFLLHTIGNDITSHRTDPWTEKYIFPNSMLPSAAQISSAIEGRFIMEDWHNFGADYDRTLMAWYANFHSTWSEISDRYDERFYRMWRYYLLTSAGSFRSRRSQLWQIVLSPEGVPEGYRAPHRALRRPET